MTACLAERIVTDTVAGLHDATRLWEDVRAAMAEDSLADFVRLMWHVVEPVAPLVWGRVLDVMCDHLEAVERGDVTRLLVNVPPGAMKSLLTNVFFPAWVWGPRNRPSMRFLAFSYTSSLTERDNQKFAMVVSSPIYKRQWGSKVKLPPVMGSTKVSNRATGWKLASSVQGVGTGERGDFVLIDDPHNVSEGESQSIRESTVRWFSESITTRLNDMEKSSIVVIMQRVNEDDVSGHIITTSGHYCHLCLPMEYDGRNLANQIGFRDWRTDDGELLWPERFPIHVLDRDRIFLGPYAVASQWQQLPTPRGGAIILDEWWQAWPPEGWPERDKIFFPNFELVVASLDTAYGLSETNDYNALTVWGVFRDIGTLVASPYGAMAGYGGGELTATEDQPKIMLMYGWQKRLNLMGTTEDRPSDLTAEEWMAPEWRGLRTKNWGLVEWVADTCAMYGVSILLIENKSRGSDVEKELKRIYAEESFTISMVNPTLDKLERLRAVQPMFSGGQVWAPIGKQWAQTVITQVSAFPRGRHDDIVDTVSMALKWMRSNGIALLKREVEHNNDGRAREYGTKKGTAYDV